MKNNYPIKYAVIPMIEQVGWSHGINELEREYGTVCYIVSKCYLVEESKKYNADGSVRVKYHVVCPYQYDEFYEWNRVEPTFNIMHGQCTNDIVVDEVYDSLEDARVSKDEKNQEIFQKLFIYMPYEIYKKRRKEIESKFNNTLAYYNQLEAMIENNVQDLNEDNDKNKVIKLVRE